MKIEDFLLPTHVDADLKAADKRDVLQALSKQAGMALGIDPTEILQHLNAREALGSTGMGDGIAIPHVRMPEVMKPFGMFARLRKPIDFDAVDGRTVDMVFLLLLPAAEKGIHLSALACVARRLRDSHVAEKLRSARSADEAFEVLKEGS